MNEQTWSVLLGLVVMLVTSAAKNPRWTVTQKTLAFAGVSALGAVVQLAIEGQLKLDGDLVGNLGQNFSIVVTTATMLYNLYFKKTEANAKLEAVGYGSVEN